MAVHWPANCHAHGEAFARPGSGRPSRLRSASTVKIHAVLFKDMPAVKGCCQFPLTQEIKQDIEGV